MILTDLAARVRTMGSAPLLTHIDATADTRIELSGTTLANWVDKTVSMIEGLGIEAGDAIALEVAWQRPDHWVSLVWALAAWQFGSPIVPGEGAGVTLVVTGPEGVTARPDIETVACSLHPWGLGFDSLPPGVVDYRDVLAEPDVHWSNAAPERPFANLAWDALDAPPQPNRVVISNPTDPVEVLRTMGVVLAGGGSLVLVHGNADLGRVAASERAELIV